MRSRLSNILLLAAVVMMYQSCDSTLNIDKPNDFYKYIGQDGDQTGVDLVTDSDGNIYILGSSKIASDTLGQQLYIIKTGPSGEVVWSKTFGDKVDETPKDIEMLNDGTLVVLGDRSDGDFVIYIIDRSSGAELKPAVIKGTPGITDHTNSITQTTDGFIVAGYTDNGAFKTAKVTRYYADMTDFQFPGEWDYRLTQLEGPGGYDVVPVKIIQKDADHFFIFGYTNTPGIDNVNDFNYFVQSTNGLNDPWAHFVDIDGPDPLAHTDERLTSVKQVPVQSGGGFILTGYTSARNGSTQDIYVARVVQDPTFATQTTFLQSTPRVISSNLVNLSSSIVSVCPSTISGFYLLANAGLAGDNNLYLTKLDNQLDNAWGDNNPARTLGGVGDDSGGAVAETADGRVLVVGTMVLGDLKGQRKIVLMNLNSDGMFGN